MSEQNAVVAIYNTHADAEAAIRELHDESFPIERLLIVGGVTAIGAGLLSLGLPEGSVQRYETAIKAGQFLLVAYGTAAEAAQARYVLRTTGPRLIEMHTVGIEQPCTSM